MLLGANAVFLARVKSHELDEVEGDQALLVRALTIVRRFEWDGTAKAKWLSESPCVFSLAPRPDGHFPLTCEFMDSVRVDLVKIAAGDVSNIPQDWNAQEAIMQRIPLSSQASEGVHRETRLVKVRPPASAIPWILATSAEIVDVRWRLGVPLEALGMTDLSLVKSGSPAFAVLR